MELSPLVWVIGAIVLAIIVLRIFFKIAGWIIKLLVLAAVGVAIWYILSGGVR